MIYLDNAATTLKKPESVIAAVVEAMQCMGNSARGVHEQALTSSRRIFETRQAIASLFGCPRADHVVFTANSTQALNIAINGLLNSGDHVITTDMEHNSVLRPLYRLQTTLDVQLDFIESDPYGNLDYSEFSKRLCPRTRAIISTHASNLTGNLLDIRRIGTFAKSHGLMYVVDASQTAGSLEISMDTMGIDVLCFTGHKGLMGPQGTGGLCVMPGVDIRPWSVGGTGVHTYSKEQPEAYPTRLEAGTLNGHGIAGLLAAIQYINEITPQVIHSHEIRLMRQFYDTIQGIDGIRIYGDFSCDRSPIVALNIRDYDSSLVADELSSTYGIAVRSGAHCAPRMHMALGTKLQGAVRFSFGWFNTEEEVETAITAVRRIAQC